MGAFRPMKEEWKYAIPYSELVNAYLFLPLD